MSDLSEKYRFYIAKSIASVENVNIPMWFHFRATKVKDVNTPPYYIYDSEKPNPVELETTTVNNKTHQTITVWLTETNEVLPAPLNTGFGEDDIFSSVNPPNFESIVGKIIVNVKLKPLGQLSWDVDNATEVVNGGINTLPDNIVYDEMDAEYPIV